eukprot:1156759-Pelagomonas_calceolata.AAC.2
MEFSLSLYKVWDWEHGTPLIPVSAQMSRHGAIRFDATAMRSGNAACLGVLQPGASAMCSCICVVACCTIAAHFDVVCSAATAM